MNEFQKVVRGCLVAKGYYGTVTKNDEFIVRELEKRTAWEQVAAAHLAGKSVRFRAHAPNLKIMEVNR